MYASPSSRTTSGIPGSPASARTSLRQAVGDSRWRPITSIPCSSRSLAASALSSPPESSPKARIRVVIVQRRLRIRPRDRKRTDAGAWMLRSAGHPESCGEGLMSRRVQRGRAPTDNRCDRKAAARGPLISAAADPRAQALPDPEGPMSFRWCSEFVRTGCVLPPLAMLPARHFAERAGGAERTRDLETDLRQFFAGTADPLLVLDSSLRVSAINAAACRYLATTVEVAMDAPAL